MRIVFLLCLYFVTYQLSAATLMKEHIWPSGTVLQIHFLDGTKEQQQLIENTARIWESFTSYRFEFHHRKPVKDEVSHIRITFNDFGNWSKLGTQALNFTLHEPTIALSVVDRSWVSLMNKKRVILHEFGHVMAFIHEHQNPNFNLEMDEEFIYTWCREQRSFSRSTCHRNIIQKASFEDVIPSDFDIKSMMMYKMPQEFFVDGDVAADLPNYELSDLDKQMASQL